MTEQRGQCTVLVALRGVHGLGYFPVRPRRGAGSLERVALTMDRLLCGLRVATDLPLPDLLPWTGDDRPADLDIRLGAVPQQLDAPAHIGPLLQVSANGDCRLAIPGVAAYLAVAGQKLVVEPEAEADAAAVRLFLLGTMFGFIAHQRGLLPLHAGCVEIDGQAIAFTGPSGAGKSTLTAAFLRRGHRILSDDLTVIDLTGDVPVVRPSFPRVKLWQDSLEALGWDGSGLSAVRSGVPKFELPLDAAFQSAPLPLAAIYHLGHAASAADAGIARLRGADAMRALLASVYRHQRAMQMGFRAAITQATIALAPIPNLRLSRVLDLAAIDATVDTIVARHTPR